MKKHIWLASYPRSGNTFVRTILKECFDLRAESKYEDKMPGMQAADSFEGSDTHSVEHPLITKTHEAPENDDPAIYIIRDGRAAIVSYFYFNRYFGATVPVEAIIMGAVGYGSWSDHYRAWNPLNRPHTLFLKYEELITETEEAIENIAAFIGVRPVRQFSKTFEDLHKTNRLFFRIGDNDRNIAELTDSQLELFAQHHGKVMQELGYFDSGQALLESAPRDRMTENGSESTGTARPKQMIIEVEMVCRAKDKVIFELNKDRRTQAALIERLTRETQEIEVDRRAKDELIERLTGIIQEIENDRRAKDEVIARLTRNIEDIEKDRRAKDELIARLSRKLGAMDENRRAKTT